VTGVGTLVTRAVWTAMHAFVRMLPEPERERDRL